LQAGRTGGVGEAGERKLVGIATEPSIGDFGGTLVRRLCSEGEAEQESKYEQQFTHCGTTFLRLQM
jgi:hypothetical protein